MKLNDVRKQTFSVGTTVGDFIKSAMNFHTMVEMPQRRYGRIGNGLDATPKVKAQFFDLAESLLKGDPVSVRTAPSRAEEQDFVTRYGDVLTLMSLEHAGPCSYNDGAIAVIEDVPDQVKALCEVADLDEAKVRAILLSGTEGHYRSFTIPKKSGGRRKIEAPDADLMEIQRKLLDHIVYKFGPSSSAHGFVCGRSLATNARHHIGMKQVLKLDLKDFFTTCTVNMVKGAMWPLMKDEFRFILGPLVELVTKNGVLPQGAPTSPALANLCFAYADFFLKGLAGRTDCTYTRYADDLVFSSDTFDVKKLIPVVDKVLVKFGFVRNQKKTDVLKSCQRQKVTGVVVNVKMSIPRRTRRNFRACLHNILVGKQDCDAGRFAKLKGKMAFFKMVSSEQAAKFADNLVSIEQNIVNAPRLAFAPSAASAPKTERPGR